MMKKEHGLVWNGSNKVNLIWSSNYSFRSKRPIFIYGSTSLEVYPLDLKPTTFTKTNCFMITMTYRIISVISLNYEVEQVSYSELGKYFD